MTPLGAEISQSLRRLVWIKVKMGANISFRDKKGISLGFVYEIKFAFFRIDIRAGFIPMDLILEYTVVRFTPSNSAAPSFPEIRHWVFSRIPRIYFRWNSSKV